MLKIVTRIHHVSQKKEIWKRSARAARRGDLARKYGILEESENYGILEIGGQEIRWSCGGEGSGLQVEALV